MRILVSNDDGYLAPGIVALAEVLSEIAQVTVVAPESNRSGSSNSLTLDLPLRVEHVRDKPYTLYYINGTPSDCVHVALTGLLDQPPDLVVSGINHGQNMGDDTIYSGTVAAATEGFLFGIPAVAFSHAEKGWKELDSAARVAHNIIQWQIDHFEELRRPYLWNVNIPNLPYEQLKTWVVTRLGRRHAAEPVYKMCDPHGRNIYWIGPYGAAKDAGDGTDFHAVANGHISITPLQVDLTHVSQLEALKNLL